MKKYILIGMLSGMSLCAQAQFGGAESSNALLNRSFWKENPSLDDVKGKIKAGSDPAEMNQMHMDPVTIAILGGGSTEAIIYLIQQNGNQVNTITHEGRTYLQWATGKGLTDVVQYLISKGAKADVKDEHGISAVNFAAINGQTNVKLYDLLLTSGADLKDVNRQGANALLLAATADSTGKVVSYFQSKGLDINSKDAEGHTAIDYAAKTGNTALIKILLEKGVKYSKDIMLVAAKGARRSTNGIETYKYLETIGAKPTITDSTGNNALHYVVRHENQEAVINYFLSKGVKPSQVNNEGNNVFMIAASATRDTAVLSKLLKITKVINQKNKAGETALYMAVGSNNADVIRFLINNGADIQTMDVNGHGLTFNLFESYNRRTSRDFGPKLEVLQKNGLDLKAPMKDGSTIYHLAVVKNDFTLLKDIEPLGADINAKNSNGMTALHKAAGVAKDDKIMKYLIAKGADKTSKTDFGETPYDLAKENEFLGKANISLDFLK